MTGIKEGDSVWWDDPDEGISSGLYEVTKAPVLEEGEEENAYDIFTISNGSSEAEVPRCEIELYC